jgi:hypothetical protein
VSANHDLAAQLGAALGTTCSVSTQPVMVDLLWGCNTEAERERAGLSIFVEKPGSRRRIVLMTVKDEIRYWATTDKDPFASSKSSLGVVASFAGAVLFCHEFVARELAIDHLTAPLSRLFYDTDR